MKSFLILSTLLTVNSLSPSFEESYAIKIPTNLNLSDSGSFQISLNENNLADNETININIDDTFTLSDSHGKPNIYGSITNNEITFTKSDSETKTIYYEVTGASPGSWTGNLNLNIEVVKETNENTFDTGSAIQYWLNRLKPTKITFSHDVIEGNSLLDLSVDKDGSILLYRSGKNITITNMKNEKFKANSDMSSFFKGLSYLTCIENLDYIDMSTCTNMSDMFSSCSALSSMDVSSFDVSNVTNMANAFSSLNSCTSIGDISNWDVSNVTSFEKLFYCDYKLNNYGDLGKWNISNNCTNISYMFASCSYEQGVANSSFFPSTLDLTNWDVSNVNDMSYAFKNSFNLENINISTWQCTNVTNMQQMFAMEDSENVSKLNGIVGIDNLNIANANKTEMFLNCDSLTKPSWYQ